MAKKKKASAKHAKHAKQSAAPSSSHKKSPFPTAWVVGAVIVVIVLLLLFKGRRAPEIPEPSVAPEAPEAEAPAEEELDEDEGVLVPSEVEIIGEKTGMRAGAYDPMVWETGSFFGGIKCMKSTGFRTDVLEFQLKNKESFPIHIESVAPGDTTKNPTSFSINGHRFEGFARGGVQKGCGTGVVEPEQTVTCTFETPLRHYGSTGTKAENTLQLKIRTSEKKVTSQVNFYC